ncbi:hypothetical protein [Chitinophaga sp. sic0106]|uniref:hypothetical protein n=1 Tax=Chitinophaga sp. sic0106 TaxID=2854785 RepID=UPI001C485E7E|nr:hypothetical protein [Chitinophaga sp. sic0106]MBV7528910.1 hypothetical protein [Chitinophaga sp. sic0106]
MANNPKPDRNKEPIPTQPEKPSPDRQEPGKHEPTPMQPPPDQPEIRPIPQEIPDRQTPHQPADPQTN